MVPEVKKVLLDVDTQRAEKITLKIQTNGTIMPDKEWTEILQKFKRTKINKAENNSKEADFTMKDLQDRFKERFPIQSENVKSSFKPLNFDSIFEKFRLP